MAEILIFTSICGKGNLLRSSVDNRTVLNWDSSSVEVLFQLLRIALGKEEPSSLPNDVNWQEVYDLSLKQGVGAIACDGMLALKECSIDEELRYKWMGQSMVIEQKYYHHKKVLAELSSFFQQRGIRMMLLKGYGLSLNYPVPEHRPSGDIDIFFFGEKSKADDYLTQDLGITVKTSYDKHSSFDFRGVTVENHAVFFDLDSHPSNSLVNEQICKLIDGRTDEIKVGESSVIMPNPTLMAVHLLRHTACDFAANSISLRQVLDWATLVSQRGSEMEWPVIISFVEKTGMLQFFCLINSFCEERLGLDRSLFPLTEEMPVEDGRFIKDILFGKRVSDFPSTSHKVYYGIRKTMQFWQNRWKYKMVYSDSLFKLYITIAKNRLIH